MKMTKHPFVVNVATLRRQPGASLHERREGPIRELAVLGSSVPEGATVVVDVLLESAYRTDWAENFNLVGEDHALVISGAAIQYPTRQPVTE